MKVMEIVSALDRLINHYGEQKAARVFVDSLNEAVKSMPSEHMRQLLLQAFQDWCKAASERLERELGTRH